MPCPSKLVVEQQSFDAGNLSLFQDFHVCNKVTPVNVEDGAETALVETLEEADVTAVGDPSLRPVEEGGKNHSPVDPDLCLALQVFVDLDPFVQPAKGAVCLRESVVNFSVNPCIGGDGATQVGELLC